MTTPELVCAVITLISAVVSFAYSFLALRAATGEARTLALYAVARSTALVVVSAAAFLVGPAGWRRRRWR